MIHKYLPVILNRVSKDIPPAIIRVFYPIYTKTPALRGPCAGMVINLDGILERFDRSGFDDFTFGLGFEHSLLFREGVDAFTLGHGGLRDGR